MMMRTCNERGFQLKLKPLWTPKMPMKWASRIGWARDLDGRNCCEHDDELKSDKRTISPATKWWKLSTMAIDVISSMLNNLLLHQDLHYLSLSKSKLLAHCLCLWGRINCNSKTHNLVIDPTSESHSFFSYVGNSNEDKNKIKNYFNRKEISLRKDILISLQVIFF